MSPLVEDRGLFISHHSGNAKQSKNKREQDKCRLMAGRLPFQGQVAPEPGPVSVPTSRA